MKELLQELEKKRDYWLKEINSDNDIRSDSALGRSKGYEGAIDLINTHMAGKVIVPVEPTDEMLAELWIDPAFSHKAMSVRYKAMLSTIKGEGDE